METADPQGSMVNKIPWVLFGIISFFLLVFFLRYLPLNYGGDIAEYYGITESLLKNGTIHLTDTTSSTIATYLQPEYLHDPGYYIAGKEGLRYPVHFIFYSILCLPARIILGIFQLNQLNALRLTNLLIFSITVFLILKNFLNSPWKKILFLISFYLSPIVWFIYWPGPDVYYLCLMLLSIFYFYQKKYPLSILLMSLASWHSQPLLITTLGMVAYYFASHTLIVVNRRIAHIHLSLKLVAFAMTIFFLLFIPYLYNLFAFGVLTPWTLLQDGWTQINGFGLQNISLQKLYEQVFDLNVGLFWYAPILVVGGFYYLIRSVKIDRDSLFLGVLFLVTAFFYQTNPAWNYGTTGYGPSRHAIFLLPLVLYFFTRFLKKSSFSYIIVSIFFITQFLIFSFNGYLTPNLDKSHYHTPYATFILNNFPSFYNPTPEIFVDRTNHIDLDHPTSAVYKLNGICKKAYMLKTDMQLLKQDCGSIPSQYDQVFDTILSRKANYARTVKTNEATFWPDPGSCADDYAPVGEKQYVCMHSIDDVLKLTGLQDATRFSNLNNLPGVWKMSKGNFVKITVPPGYFIDYSSTEGFYVTY